MRGDEQGETETAGDRHFAHAWLAEHGDALYAYSLARVGGDASLAEDLVQETLLAGVEGHSSFRGDASPRTWLIGILRRKIVDHVRRTRRSPERNLEEFFSSHGHIRDVSSWPRNADESILRDEFHAALDSCLDELTAPLHEAFLCCVMDELSTDDACSVLGVSPTNLSVRLHRARLALRKCLQSKWFCED